MEKHAYAVGDRVEKLCATCGVERGHVVASVNKRGQVSRVDCPACGTRSTFKSGVKATGTRSSPQAGAPYDPARTYRAGQTMMHPAFGLGEVTAVIEPQKIDVLFADRLRRLIHGRV
jgi:DNA-directed RNA polymerase subunit RPC12/RpoP